MNRTVTAKVALIAVTQLALVGLAVAPQLSARVLGDTYVDHGGVAATVDPDLGDRAVAQQVLGRGRLVLGQEPALDAAADLPRAVVAREVGTLLRPRATPLAGDPDTALLDEADVDVALLAVLEGAQAGAAEGL